MQVDMFHDGPRPFVGRYVLPVAPKAAQRTRARVVQIPGRKPFAQVYNAPAYAKQLDSLATLLAREWRAAPITRPVVVRLTFVFTRPTKPVKAFQVRGERLPYPYPWTDGRVPHLGQADVDNLAKLVLDAMQCSPSDAGGRGMLADDRFVVQLHCVKMYAAQGEAPCTEIEVWWD